MYVKVNKSRYLVQDTLPKSKEVHLKSTKEKTNHVFIFDRSGSMGWTLRDLIEDLIKQAQALPDGDTFTAGWFSSQSEFGWICKGLSLTENRNAIPTMLRKYNDTVGMTCYSEILQDTNKVIDDLSAISKNNALAFFSDGYPNQSVNSITSICKGLAPKLSSVMLLGYGSFYGRDFMAGMAQSLGGILVHSSNISEFSKSYTSFREGSENLQPRVEYKVPADAKEFITTLDKNGYVVTHSIEDKTLYISPETTHILYFTEKEPKVKKFTHEALLPAIYAVARSASQLANYPLAIQTLGVIGDVKYIDAFNNAFTIGEYGGIEAELLDAVTDNNMRFVKGQRDNYVPSDDQFCGLQLLDALVNDPTAALMIKHPAFVYRSISRGTKAKNPDLKFQTNADAKIGLRSLVFSDEKLNVSLGANTFGTVALDADAPKHGLNQLFAAKKYNNYTIIYDGKWNVTDLPVVDLSPETKKLVHDNGLVVSENGVTVLKLTRIPVINRKIAGSHTDLNEVCDILKQELVLEGRQKAYKAIYSRVPEDIRKQIDDLVRPAAFNSEQVEYLSKFGIDKEGVFSPEKETLPVRDVVPYTMIKFAVKGFSSVPAIAKVEEKLAEKKKLTPSEQNVADALSLYSVETSNINSDKQKALYLKESIEQIRKDLFTLRSELNTAKFAVILGKTNFTQLPKLDNGDNSYEYQGLTYQIKLNRDAKEEI